MRSGWTISVAAFFLAACNGGDDGGGVPADTTQAVEDAETVTTLLAPLRAVSRAEVEFGQLGAQRAASPAIQQYAQTIAADHRAVLTTLDDLARQRSATLSEEGAALEMANMVRMAHAGLENLTGPDFDLPYIRAEVESHRQLLDRLDQHAIPGARSSELRTTLTDLRAMAEAHLTRARQLLAQQLGEMSEPDRGEPPIQQPRPRPAAPPPVDTVARPPAPPAPPPVDTIGR